MCRFLLVGVKKGIRVKTHYFRVQPDKPCRPTLLVSLYKMIMNVCVRLSHSHIIKITYLFNYLLSYLENGR